jgi:hypothetical protein
MPARRFWSGAPTWWSSASADEVANELRRLRSVYPLQQPMSALVGRWQTAALGGDGPSYIWSLPVTAEHRPAVLYYVEASGCGTATHASAADPVRVVVR